MTLSDPIYFLFPEDFLRKSLPDSISSDWSECGGSSEGAVYSTMLGLKESGIAVKATSSWPNMGIVIAHSRDLPIERPANWKDLYIVCWQIDHMRCDYAQLHIVSNSSMLKNAGISLYDRLLLPGPRIIQHFPTELNLKPRDIKRNSIFSNIAYAGAPKNLMTDFQTEEWFARIRHESLNFRIIESPVCMGDYSDIDCVLAVRPSGQQIEQKPPSKLWNAWRAGVPAILGPEPGFRDYRKTELDYIEVTNVEEALQALIRLRENPELRLAMTENGFRRLDDCSLQTIISQWINFIEEPLQNYAYNWFHAPCWKRKLFYVSRTFRMALRKIRNIIN